MDSEFIAEGLELYSNISNARDSCVLGILYTCPAGKGSVLATAPPQSVSKYCVWLPSKLLDVFEKSTVGLVML